MKKFICKLTKEELYHAYIEDGRTLNEMCEYVGVKSPITMSKILRENGIETDRNKRLSDKSKMGMDDESFKEYIQSLYNDGLSMNRISAIIGITPSGVRKYFVKYGIERRGKAEIFKSHDTNPAWKGGRHIAGNGYVEIFMPNHPNANVRKYVYEHQLVMERKIGRPLKKGEVVHHIDGDKTNNKISNLLLLTASEHAKLHAIINKSKKLMGGGSSDEKCNLHPSLG